VARGSVALGTGYSDNAMLTALSIRDVVLIDQLDLTFSGGLCVLTGETGAGKSILLDALGLALGARGDSALVRHGAERAVITAIFEPVDDALGAILGEHGFDADGSLILRRVLSADGRSRAFVNDQPAGINLLRSIGKRLVEIQGQFAQHQLAEVRTHCELLDAFSACNSARQSVAEAFSSWRNAASSLANAVEQAAKARADEEFLRHAVEELGQLDPQAGEEAQLSDTRMVLMHAEQLVEAMNSALSDLSGADGAENSLATARRQLARVADKSGGRLDSTITALDGAIANVEDALRELGSAANIIEHSSNRLDEVEDRLHALRETARKHGVKTDELMTQTKSLRQRLALIENQSDTLAQLEEAERISRAKYMRTASALSRERAAAATRLEEAVAGELPALKLEKTRLTVAITEQVEQLWNANGVDRVEFLVTTNPGMPAGALSKIASGGELSRLMLALKLTLIEVDQVPTLIFDEVDSAIGGATANAVGERLARLAERTQVLVVTHSPQVAARGTDHLRVEKTALGDEAVTGVDRLGDLDRREEVARMLSGARITAEARAAAKRLISGDRA
jgi:DNA repair protein RecN (Recombination protein N)